MVGASRNKLKKKKRQRKVTVSLCSSHVATDRRPIWPHVHSRGPWGLKHVDQGLVSNQFIRRHHPESLNILRKAL